MENGKSFDVTDQFAMAGAGDPKPPVEADPDAAVEITPITFDKDLMDFRPTDPDVVEAEVPKGRSAQAPVSGLTSSSQMPLGLEDESPDAPNPEVPDQTLFSLPTNAQPPAGTGI